MAVIAIATVRDEADIIRATVERMLAQVDVVIVADNRSVDGTREILEQLPVTLIDDPEVGYWQSQKMTALAERARDEGAEWVVPFDADEVWLARDGRRIADALLELPDSTLIARADLYDHVSTGHDPGGDPVTRMAWRRLGAAPLPKIACRAMPGLVVQQGNHGAWFDHTDLPPTISNVLTVRHFPYRSVEQFISKARNGAAAYAATDLPDDVGKHWRDYGRLLEAHGPDALGDVFREHFWCADPTAANELVYDPCP